MAKFIDKKFMKCIEKMMPHIKKAKKKDFVEELQHILETKTLTIDNASTLIPFLFERVNFQASYEKEFNYSLSHGISYENALKIFKQIKKDDKYMYKILQKYFIMEEKMGMLRVQIPEDIREMA